MKLIDFIKVILKNYVLLISVPVAMAALVFILTMKPNYKYVSETTLFTGIATGSSVEMDKSFNYFIINTAFDNLINIVKSRNTQKEVAIRLLSLHLMLDEPIQNIINEKNYNHLKQITPPGIYQYVVKDDFSVNPKSEYQKNNPDPFNIRSILPESINLNAYEKTVENLTRLMESNDTNFVYNLLNYPNSYYSYKDLSTIKVTRVFSSDMIQLKYETDDPGICQTTLSFLTIACIRNYRTVKENRSDAVIRYFEDQLENAAKRLKVAEDNLLQFNKENNIINYYEQSKAVAVVKEDLEVDFNNRRIKLAGVEASILRIEEKLNIQEKIQTNNSKFVEKRNQLGILNSKIIFLENFSKPDDPQTNNLAQLKAEALKIEAELKQIVSGIYSNENSKEGIPIEKLLDEWITNVIEAENLKAGITVLESRIKEFQKQYEIYAPAGANIKRIEREISISEQEFLEILHGLNLARLKLQDNELSANLKIVDPPYFPLTPVPTKRKILVALAAMVGFVLVLSFILFAQYFDNTLKNLANASTVLKLDYAGILPNLKRKNNGIPTEKLTHRLVDFILQQLDIKLRETTRLDSFKTLLLYSTQPKEGKTIVAGNIARKLKESGKTVFYFNYKEESVNAMLSVQDIKANSSSKNEISGSFLDNPNMYLSNDEYVEFTYKDLLFSNNFHDFIRNYSAGKATPDYVLIEIPSIIQHRYPPVLSMNVDLPLLVCRANRIWNEADQIAISTLSKDMKTPGYFILNGAEIDAIEMVTGELPKKRSKVRKFVKNFISFQFFTKTKI